MGKVQFVGTSVVAALVLLAASADARAQTFAARPGAWENTISMAGTVIPPEVLEKMPPDRRAIVEQQMSASGGLGRPQVRKTCVTKENLEKGFTPSANSSCTVAIVSKTSTKMVMTTTCTAPPSTGTMTWEAKTPESVVGSIDQDQGGRKIHISVVGKWLGASCDGIDPPPAPKGG